MLRFNCCWLPSLFVPNFLVYISNFKYKVYSVCTLRVKGAILLIELPFSWNQPVLSNASELVSCSRKQRDNETTITRLNHCATFISTRVTVLPVVHP